MRSVNHMTNDPDEESDSPSALVASIVVALGITAAAIFFML